MKKILVLLGILCLLVFALSCGGTQAPESNTEEAVSESAGSATEEAGGAAEEAGGETQTPSEEEPAE